MFRTKQGAAQGALFRGDRLTLRLMLLPSLIGVGVFFLIPFGVVVYDAFIGNPFAPSFVGVDNFVSLMQNESFRIAVGNTAVFLGVTLPLAVCLPLALSALLEHNIPGKSKFRTFFLSPVVVPTASVALIWQVFFHQNGVVNDLMGLIGADGVDWLRTAGYDKAVIVLLFVWKNLGYNMVLFTAALSSVPRELLEAAEIDGAGAWKRFWHIKLRYLSPAVLFVTLLSLINSFKIFREVYLLSGSYPSEGLYMLQHFMNNIFYSLDYPKLSAATVLMTLVLAVALGVFLVLEERFRRDVEE